MKLKNKIVKILLIAISLIIFLSISVLVYEVTLSSRYSKIIKNEEDLLKESKNSKQTDLLQEILKATKANKPGK